MVTATRVVVAARAFRWVFALPVYLQGSFPVVPVWSVPFVGLAGGSFFCACASGGLAIFRYVISIWGSGSMGVNGHDELEWRRQSPGRLDERLHRCLMVLSRAVGGLAVRWVEFARARILLSYLVSVELSEAVGAVASRFEGAFLSVARSARLSFSTGFGL
ncbi:hypothetical protein IGI04_026514 [Brassica rapa subsp. trilocularis]|uniref:Uncharacterized protein n=1 Tax=Brassica rapa subsp. trilocularis TaxID=1813537 RepID=A0ABQ7KXI6_BRACM|nr:hypothetical protein IGI04_026514 [Brassica rapa subsp. trilocularis]